MLEWNTIDTVLLDMDGTLLDLHFDNYFWREHVPQRYAEKHALPLETAKSTLHMQYLSKEGTMEWYCVDYWTRELGLDIAQLKAEVDHLIAVHPYVIEFLDALRRLGKHVALVTNAHQKSLMLKLNKTALDNHLDQVICAHDVGMPKEDPRFWQQLHNKLPFDAAHTLLIDDSLPVLRSARAYGIQHLLAVYQPDSKTPRKEVADFAAISSFLDIMPAPQ
jgi:putative hydrolase of the HAD superfamily